MECDGGINQERTSSQRWNATGASIRSEDRCSIEPALLKAPRCAPGYWTTTPAKQNKQQETLLSIRGRQGSQNETSASAASAVFSLFLFLWVLSLHMSALYSKATWKRLHVLSRWLECATNICPGSLCPAWNSHHNGRQVFNVLDLLYK